MVEVFIGFLGKLVVLEDIIKGFKGFVEGEYDYFLEVVFYMVGLIDEVIEKV